MECMADSSTQTNSSAAGRARSALGIVGACLACCLPMLVVVGAVSAGAALTGGAIVGVVALVAGIAWLSVRGRFVDH